jgi:hypothetical protein
LILPHSTASPPLPSRPRYDADDSVRTSADADLPPAAAASSGTKTSDKYATAAAAAAGETEVSVEEIVDEDIVVLDEGSDGKDDDFDSLLKEAGLVDEKDKDKAGVNESKEEEGEGAPPPALAAERSLGAGGGVASPSRAPKFLAPLGRAPSLDGERSAAALTSSLDSGLGLSTGGGGAGERSLGDISMTNNNTSGVTASAAGAGAAGAATTAASSSSPLQPRASRSEDEVKEELMRLGLIPAGREASRDQLSVDVSSLFASLLRFCFFFCLLPWSPPPSPPSFSLSFALPPSPKTFSLAFFFLLSTCPRRTSAALYPPFSRSLLCRTSLIS